MIIYTGLLSTQVTE